jgi:soluble lytic murein transglycosylase-like protein
MKSALLGPQFVITTVLALGATALSPVRSDPAAFSAVAGAPAAFAAIAPPRATFSAQATYARTSTANRVDRVYALLQQRRMGLDDDRKRHVAHTIVREAARYRLSPELVLAVIDTESSYRTAARSHQGAIGLMQILPDTGKSIARECGVEWAGEETLLDPLANVRLGTHYLASLQKRFGSLDHALAAYNWGPTRIAGLLRTGAPVPQVYTRKVLASRRAL